jgi:hypothetical protein
MPIPVQRLELYVTTRCNARCRHCCFPASGKGVDTEMADALRWVEEAASAPTLEYLLIFGGEPMLNQEAVLAVARAGVEHKIKTIEIITNAFWADTTEHAKYWVKELQQAGLSMLVMSVDVFHAEWVPVANLRRAGVAAREAGLRVLWNVSLLERRGRRLPEDQQSWEIVDSLRDISEEINDNNEVIPAGRALENFESLYVRKPGIPAGPCPGPCYATDIVAPTVLTLFPNGDVWACWGLTIGNVKHASLAELIRDYDPEKNELVHTIVAHGPAGLLHLPAAQVFVPKAGYVNECELCQEVLGYLAGEKRP